MEKEYLLAKDRIIFIILFISFALIVAARGFFLYYTLGQPAWILPGSVPLLIAIVLFRVLTTRKVIITSKSIIRVGMLSTKEILFIHTAGYRLRDIPLTGLKKLVLVASKEADDMDIRYFQLADGEEILSFVVEKFRDLEG